MPDEMKYPTINDKIDVNVLNNNFKHLDKVKLEASQLPPLPTNIAKETIEFKIENNTDETLSNLRTYGSDIKQLEQLMATLTQNLAQTNSAINTIGFNTKRTRYIQQNNMYNMIGRIPFMDNIRVAEASDIALRPDNVWTRLISINSNQDIEILSLAFGGKRVSNTNVSNFDVQMRLDITHTSSSNVTIYSPRIVNNSNLVSIGGNVVPPEMISGTVGWSTGGQYTSIDQDMRLYYITSNTGSMFMTRNSTYTYYTFAKNEYSRTSVDKDNSYITLVLPDLSTMAGESRSGGVSNIDLYLKTGQSIYGNATIIYNEKLRRD